MRPFFSFEPSFYSLRIRIVSMSGKSPRKIQAGESRDEGPSTRQTRHRL